MHVHYRMTFLLASRRNDTCILLIVCVYVFYLGIYIFYFMHI